LLNIEPASGEAGEANISLSMIDDKGAIVYQTFTVLVEKHAIVASSSNHGIIVPSGKIEVNTGQPYVFKIIPDDGYVIDQISVDSKIVTSRPTYTFWNIRDSHQIVAIFREADQYTITTQAGTGGTIEPNGNVILVDGSTTKFNIEAKSGYEIDYLRVDNTYVAATNEYTFENIKTPHSLEAFFKAVPAPVASFKASPVIGGAPLEVSFKDNSQNTITSREWHFGDGTSTLSLNPKHTYFKPGTYTVSYSVKGPGGEDVLVKEDLVVIYDLQVDFSATPTTGFFPLTSTFSTQLDDAVTHVLWNFGDGDTSMEVNPTHVYKTPGNYTVQLTALASGNVVTEMKSNYIKVKGRNISGRVTGSDTGEGLSGYMVEVFSYQSKLPIAETYTDSNGYYSFVCGASDLSCISSNKIPAAADLIVAVWPPFQTMDYYRAYYEGQ
ncbi:PKD domain protein, partial [Candidatus Magnetomorum sp. HK-1]